MYKLTQHLISQIRYMSLFNTRMCANQDEDVPTLFIELGRGTRGGVAMLFLLLLLYRKKASLDAALRSLMWMRT